MRLSVSTAASFIAGSILSLLRCAHRITARLEFVQGHCLQRQIEAVESDHVPLVNGGGRTCRISGKAIYRVLGVENIRHRRKANRNGVMRRLLSLDFVLEHPGMNWLPTEAREGRIY